MPQIKEDFSKKVICHGTQTPATAGEHGSGLTQLLKLESCERMLALLLNTGLGPHG